MGSTGHLSVQQGKQVKIYLRNGTTLLARFKRKNSRFVEFYGLKRIPTKLIKTLQINKGGDNA